MKKIPYKEWERREHADFYNMPEIPFFSICSNIDVTLFFDYCRQHRISFYYGMIYSTMTVINQMEDFKYRIRGDEVVLHDSLIPSFTELIEGSRLHKIVNAPISGNMKEYCDYAKAKAGEQKNYFPGREEEERDDFVYISCLPWVSFTMLTNTLGLNKNDFIPRVAWGKHFEESGNGTNQSPIRLLPYSMQVNHRANDGLHIGEFYQRLQQYLNTISQIAENK